MKKVAVSIFVFFFYVQNARALSADLSPACSWRPATSPQSVPRPLRSRKREIYSLPYGYLTLSLTLPAFVTACIKMSEYRYVWKKRKENGFKIRKRGQGKLIRKGNLRIRCRSISVNVAENRYICESFERES